MKFEIGKRVRRLLASRWMPAWLAVLSFLENTVLFVAVEPLFIPILAARREQIYRLAAMLLLGSIFGALAMYLVAYWAYEPLIRPALEIFGAVEAFESSRNDLAVDGLFALFLIGIMPVPFQLATLAAGALHIALLPFLVVTTISRAVRYFGLATVILVIGKPVDRFLRKKTAEFALAGASLFILIMVIWILIRSF